MYLLKAWVPFCYKRFLHLRQDPRICSCFAEATERRTDSPNELFQGSVRGAMRQANPLTIHPAKHQAPLESEWGLGSPERTSKGSLEPHSAAPALRLLLPMGPHKALRTSALRCGVRSSYSKVFKTFQSEPFPRLLHNLWLLFPPPFVCEEQFEGFSNLFFGLVSI